MKNTEIEEFYFVKIDLKDNIDKNEVFQFLEKNEDFVSGRYHERIHYFINKLFKCDSVNLFCVYINMSGNIYCKSANLRISNTNLIRGFLLNIFHCVFDLLSTIFNKFDSVKEKGWRLQSYTKTFFSNFADSNVPDERIETEAEMLQYVNYQFEKFPIY